MAERNFRELLALQNGQQRYVCVGLDTDVKNPTFAREASQAELYVETGYGYMVGRKRLTTGNQVSAYNTLVFEATRDIAATYKPNLAFYRRLGHEGITALRKTIELIHDQSPLTPVILDAKYGDIDSTNEGYAEEAFDYFKADAVTVHNYMGMEAMKPFLKRADKGVFVLDRTSNPNSAEFQKVDLVLTETELDWLLNGPARKMGSAAGWDPIMPLYEYVALRVANHWNTENNCGLVVGAPYWDEAGLIRHMVGPNIPLLIPGVGAQGQKAEDIVPVALRKGEAGVINSSRGIIFAKARPDERQQDAIRRAALELDEEILAAQEKSQ